MKHPIAWRLTRRLFCLRLTTAIVVATVAVSCTTSGNVHPTLPADLVIRGATLIDGTGAAACPATTIIIRDGLIVAVAPDSTAKAVNAATVIDATGKYVIPGLADMHVHLGSGGLEPHEATTVDRVLGQFLFYGVTTIFNVGATGGDAASIQVLRSRIASGDVIAPHLYATGSMLTLPGSHPVATIMHVPPGVDPATYDWSLRGVTLVETPADARAAVRRNAEAGMDGIKIVVESGPAVFGDNHPQMPPEMIAAIVGEASSLGLPVVAHVSSLDEMEDAIAGGVRAIMHAVGSPYPGPEHWAEMRERNVFLVPTLSLFAALFGDQWAEPGSLNDPFLRAGVAPHTLRSLDGWQSPTASMPDDVRANLWNGGLASIAAAQHAGVPIALGTDTNNPGVFPGYSVHVELELLVEAGLTPMEALVSGTRRPAEMLRQEDVFGTIAPGKRADLLILAANPLQDITNTRSLEVVVSSGRVLDREQLMRRFR